MVEGEGEGEVGVSEGEARVEVRARVRASMAARRGKHGGDDLAHRPREAGHLIVPVEGEGER